MQAVPSHSRWTHANPLPPSPPHQPSLPLLCYTTVPCLSLRRDSLRTTGCSEITPISEHRHFTRLIRSRCTFHLASATTLTSTRQSFTRQTSAPCSGTLPTRCSRIGSTSQWGTTVGRHQWSFQEPSLSDQMDSSARTSRSLRCLAHANCWTLKSRWCVLRPSASLSSPRPVQTHILSRHSSAPFREQPFFVQGTLSAGVWLWPGVWPCS